MSKQRSTKRQTDITSCTVREWDETEKGKFVAYVDYKNESFDVSISLDQEKKLTSFKCDCGSQKICRHVQALLDQVTTIKLKKSKLPNEKPGLKQVFDNADAVELKEWLWKQISANEEIKILFANDFARPTHYTAEDVTELVNNARKAIIGKTIFPTPKDVAKLGKILVTAQTPVIEFYLKAPFEKEHCAIIKTILECLDHLTRDMDESVLIRVYTKLLTPIAEGLKQIKDELSFEQAIQYLISGLKLNKPSGVCMIEILSLLITTVRFNRAYSVIIELGRIFAKDHGENNDFTNHVARLYYDCLIYHNLLQEFGNDIPVDSLDGKTNDQIVDHLIDSEQLHIAAERLWSMYEKTVQPDRKIDLLERIKSVNIEIGDEADMIKVLKILVRLTYQYEDFVLLQQYLDPKKMTRLRHELMDNACTFLDKVPTKFRFAFQVFEAEKDYEKIISHLHCTPSYELIEPAARSLIVYDSKAFLQQMFRIRDKLGPDSDYNAKRDEFESVKRLVNLTLKHYPEAELQTAIADHYKNTGTRKSMNYFSSTLAEKLEA